MNIWQAGAFGAGGGLLVEAAGLFAYMRQWQTDRRAHRRAKKRSALPALGSYLDPAADGLVLLTRAVLGLAMAMLLAHQIGGPFTGLAVGATAPALIIEFARVRTLAGVQRQAEAMGEAPAGQAAP